MTIRSFGFGLATAALLSIALPTYADHVAWPPNSLPASSFFKRLEPPPVLEIDYFSQKSGDDLAAEVRQQNKDLRRRVEILESNIKTYANALDALSARLEGNEQRR